MKLITEKNDIHIRIIEMINNYHAKGCPDGEIKYIELTETEFKYLEVSMLKFSLMKNSSDDITTPCIDNIRHTFNGIPIKIKK